MTIQITAFKRLQQTAGTTGVKFFEQDDAEYAFSLLAEAFGLQYEDSYQSEIFLTWFRNAKAATPLLKKPKKLTAFIDKTLREVGYVSIYQKGLLKARKLRLEYEAKLKTMDESDALYTQYEKIAEDALSEEEDYESKIEDAFVTNAYNPWPVDLIGAAVLAAGLGYKIPAVTKGLDIWFAYALSVSTDRPFLNAFQAFVSDYKAKKINWSKLGVRFDGGGTNYDKAIKRFLSYPNQVGKNVALLHTLLRLDPASAATTMKTNIKGGEAYTWGTYNGNGLTIVSGHGREYTLKKGARFGSRLSGSGKKIRFVFEDLGVNLVFTIPEDLAQTIYNRSTLD